MQADTFMFAVALAQEVTDTSTARERVIPPPRESTMELGLIETRGLRSFPEENRTENEPA
jgi:hypothetical protein